jgi:hypothetical protein
MTDQLLSKRKTWLIWVRDFRLRIIQKPTVIEFRYRHLPAIRQYITFLPIIFLVFFFSTPEKYRNRIKSRLFKNNLRNSRLWLLTEKLENMERVSVFRDIIKLILVSPVFIVLFIIALPFMIKDGIQYLLKPKEVRS